MPVNRNTIQPMGMLNGGASLALIETVGSMAANLAVDREMFAAVGQNVIGHHLRPALNGDVVTGRATALHLGKKSHIWEVIVHNSAGLVVCKGSITMSIIKRERKDV
jgi:1,4-dihydroxy-2-naphthoyl-CoA hydrolase